MLQMFPSRNVKLVLKIKVLNITKLFCSILAASCNASNNKATRTAGGANKTDELNTQTHRKQDYLAPVAKLSRDPTANSASTITARR